MNTGVIQDLHTEIRSCQKCPLGKTRENAVPGEGDLQAKVMFVGEAPGANEDRQGRPFCGRAGKILDELLQTAGLKRDEVFIGNILKCRPPGNRDPKPDEIRTCTPYLNTQIELIQPKVLCSLGNFAAAYLMRTFGMGGKVQGITRLHGKIFITQMPYGKIRLMPLFHPAVATYDPRKLTTLKQDFLQLKNVPK
ncbi:MAG: uracil-DNA glycosylase [Candidatus Omnitrophica bacterium]|nr:uracil-DNA glycosylase [Candidatus Omnitrophota bacterium]